MTSVQADTIIHLLTRFNTKFNAMAICCGILLSFGIAWYIWKHIILAIIRSNIKLNL